ncbi:MAG TPA: HAMP domain-containing sensor histidine kinase [Bacillota bacterium]|nr:HAMP domain-containing sensor histidine kinase [Bacillota bacterium]
MRKGKGETDSRVKKPHFAWKEFLITYAVLSVLSAGQWMIYSEYTDFTSMPVEYILGMMGYWALVSGAFALVTHAQTWRKFDEPMHRLSIAAKDVANGDFSIYLEPIHNPDKYDYMDVMFEDFNKMVEELGSIETLKADFIANVSHEIKTPLAVIQNYAQMLQKETLPYELRKDYCSTIISASQKLAALVTNILKLNKLENQEIVPTAQPYDLCRQLAEYALQFEELWESKDIEFIADLEDRAVISANEEMMGIVWQNLLSNAIKFTEPGGTITLTQTSDSDWITVTISDTGCGMSKEVIDRIFDKFYQGDSSRSQEGNGLGLALTLRVVELIGGSITVASEPGEGSTFTVTLPVGR